MINPRIGSVNFEIQTHSDFYFYFLSLTKIEFSNEVETAALILDNINFKICINPSFWSSLQDTRYKKHQFLLIHELYHLILKHYSIHKEYNDFTLFSIATDCYINYEIINKIFSKDKSYFIEGGVWYEEIGVPLDVVSEGSDSVYRYLQTSNNQNFKNLYDQVKNNQVKVLIDHSSWKDLKSDGISDNVLEKAIQNQIESQIIEASNYSRDIGSLPSSIGRIISDILNRKKSKIDWKKELSKFISLFSNKIFVKKSYNKPSKFFDDATTIKVKFKPRICIIIDTSGSMRSNDIVEAFNEVISISKKSDHDIKVIECDATITKDSVYDFVNIKQIESRLASKKVIGGGGTQVDPAIAYINKNCKDIASIIYITDGYVNLPVVKPLKPMIVVLSSGGMSIDNFKQTWSNKFKTLKIDEV